MSSDKGIHNVTQVKSMKPADPPVASPASRQVHVAMRHAPATVSTATPTINVTIGRIEVRATPAPSAPTRAPRRGTTKTSLEDYLRTRSGGRK